MSSREARSTVSAASSPVTLSSARRRGKVLSARLCTDSRASMSATPGGPTASGPPLPVGTPGPSHPDACSRAPRPLTLTDAGSSADSRPSRPRGPTESAPLIPATLRRAPGPSPLPHCSSAERSWSASPTCGLLHRIV